MCATCLSEAETSRTSSDRRRRLGQAGAATIAAPETTGTVVGSTANSVIDRYHAYHLANDIGPLNAGAVRVTFFGTTMMLFDDGATKLLVDAFVTRPSMETVLSSAIATDPAVVDAAFARAEVDQVAALFVAHSHYDHALDVAYVVQQTGAHLYGSASTLNVGRGGGLTEEQMSLYEPGKALVCGQFQVTVLPSKHSPPTPENDDIGKTIDAPLSQPAPYSAYVEGGSFDFLIRHGDNTILVKPSANFIPDALDAVQADVLFLAVGSLGNQDAAFQAAFYDETVGVVHPELVVPTHWDNFFTPLSDHLDVLSPEDISVGFDFLIERLTADGIAFGIMQGYQRVVLFGA